MLNLKYSQLSNNINNKVISIEIKGTSMCRCKKHLSFLSPNTKKRSLPTSINIFK